MKRKFILPLVYTALLFAGCKPDEQVDPGKPDKPEEPGDKVEFTDLSKEGTANSYIVNKAGEYAFKATVMGNGVSTTNVAAAELKPASARLVWQDAKNLITDVKLDGENIHFKATEGGLGNALIAAYDQDGKVIWSWHIWVTDFNPSQLDEKHQYNGVTWMDRNLGAGCAKWDEGGKVKGMIYQWGRKDPFPAIREWTDMGTITLYDAEGNEIDPLKTEVVSNAANYNNTVLNPTTYYGGIRNSEGDGPYDWYTTDNFANQNDDLWETPGDHGKTMLDPCPPGWRVPKNKDFKGLNNNSFPIDDLTDGREHKNMGYFAAVGLRGFEGGQWTGVGSFGDYWSSTASNKEGMVNTLHFLASMVNPKGNTYRAAGMPVRCVSEKYYGSGDEDKNVDLDILADQIVEASYVKSNGGDGSGNYYIGLTNDKVEYDDQGQMVPVGDGYIVYLDLYGDNSEDSDNAVLPEGTYEVSSTTNKGMANTDYTWIRYRENDEVKYHMMAGGEVVVKHTANGGYNIECNFESTEGLKINVKFEDKITFTNRGAGDVQTVITNPADVTFSEAEIIYEHTSISKTNSYDRFSINMFTGQFDANGQVITDGYAMHIDLQAEALSTKENIQIKPGIYQASDEYQAGNFMKGAVYVLIGVPIYVGTYIQEVNPANEAILFGFAQEGTIEVKRDGDQYEFIVNYVTPEGVSVKGVYPMGDVNIIDNSPAMPGGDWFSILHEDKTLVFNENDDVYAYGYNYGSAYFPGTSQFEIFVNNHDSNESFYLAFCAEEGAKSPAGTYEVAKDPENPKPGEYLPGIMNYGVFANTWCYILWDDKAEVGGAPATEGTLTITEVEDGEYKIEYTMKDDAEPKNTVSAMWQGKIRLNYY